MAKDDNMILLMTGLLQQIQSNPKIWSEGTRDLFSMAFDREKWAKMTKDETKLVLYKNESGISIVSNLLGVFET